MAWFKRSKEGITTSTREKLEVPDGIWYQCSSCKKTIPTDDLVKNLFVCPNCDYHVRIGSREYMPLIYDDGKFELLFEEIKPRDILGFVDMKPYKDRLAAMPKKTANTEAISIASGKINGKNLVTACMNFDFIGGSMGTVVGERISKAIDYCIEHKAPFLLISKSGGARMMESAFSLMQMAKSSAKLTLLAKAKLPYISLLTDPTTGGVTASYAMLGDLNIAEPNALIGFAGPRVIKETIKKDLPKGFQRSEFLLDHGFLDFIVNRKELKEKLTELLEYFSR